MKSKLALSLMLSLLLTACGTENVVSAESIPTAAQIPAVQETVTPAAEADTADMFTDRDLSADYDESTAALIQLNGDSAACDSDAVQIDGSTVTITDEGTYILTGTLNDGMIIVNAEESDKPQLVLDGVSVTSNTSAPVCISEADKVVITLAEGSENTLANGGSFSAVDGSSIDGAVFSMADLSFNGSGSLSVTSPAGHGIVCKDDLVFTGGTYNISAASHGIDANDSVRAAGSSLTVTAGKDGIHAENTDDAALGFVYISDGSFNIKSAGDGLSAGAYMQIEDGEFNIVSGGGSLNAVQQSSDAWGQFGGNAGEAPSGEMPNGEAPGGQMPNGEALGGQMPSGEMPGGQMPNGQAPEFSTNMAPSGTRPPDSPPAAAGEAGDTSASVKGLKAIGNLVINGGSFTVDSADDAVHSNSSVSVNGGSFDLSSGDDGFHADDTVTVTAGTIDIAESYEGIEGLHVDISGGSISLSASDDGLNAAGGIDQSGFGGQWGNEQFGAGTGSSEGGSIGISGGSISINASGDGLDANGTLEISGGTVIVSCPTSGDTAVLDYDAGGVISGGTFIGTGAVQMAQTFSSSRQGVISANTGNQAAGTVLTLTDSAGNVLISHESDQSFAIAILSSPDVVKGETYKLTVGSEYGEFTAS